MKITEECISCSACIDECPQSAIYNGGMEADFNGLPVPPQSEDHPWILNQLCDECKTCIEVCPVDCIVPNE